MSNSANELGPFRVQETPSASGQTYYIAIDPKSGICTIGRDSRGEAEHDAKALNAAYRFGMCHLLFGKDTP